MDPDTIYHAGNRRLQDAFDSRRISDRLTQLTRTAFTEADKTYVESAIYFFIATADAEGRPTCSFKGGPPGFVRITGPSELAFPDYDGNGMFKSLGNVRANPQVGLLFIAMDGSPKRLRVNGRAEISLDDPMMRAFHGAHALVRMNAEHIFPNCPRYIHNSKTGDQSVYTPGDGEPVEPAWKGFADFRDVVPARRA